MECLVAAAVGALPPGGRWPWPCGRFRSEPLTKRGTDPIVHSFPHVGPCAPRFMCRASPHPVCRFPIGEITFMPETSSDRRDPQRSRRRTRRRGGGGQISRLPVTEYDEQAEAEAARERNDLAANELRSMSVTELRTVSRDLDLDALGEERKEDLVDRI